MIDITNLKRIWCAKGNLNIFGFFRIKHENLAAYNPALSGVFILLLFISCAGPTRTVTRIQTDQVTDLSGRWNDTDARLTAESMIGDVLSRSWLNAFTVSKGKKPVVIVGTIRNKSSEHIDTGAFTKDIERELLNSGQVTFVASKDERVAVREERMDQQHFASQETVKEWTNETGADFMLIGTISSIVDAVEGQQVVYYQVNMELIDLESNTKAWIGEKKIKKLIEQKGYKWDD